MRRPRTAMVIGCLLACTTAWTSTSVQAGVPSIEPLVKARAESLMSQYDIAGMAIAIIDGRQQMFFNYGLASRETRTPVTEDTLFELGSISKTFTAALAAYALANG